ncbi:UxaA family hydrolase [Salmonella enterica subsp. enterica serovar Weltevreden]|nr:UxaA family hydrolase [Salmonella enterica subsp. enterica serovar Weltevreden]
MSERVSLARDYAQQLSMQKPQQAPVGELLLAIGAAGQIRHRGWRPNPSCGVASDKLIRCGGSSILLTNLLAPSVMMAKRAVTPEVGQQLIDLVVGCRREQSAGRGYSRGTADAGQYPKAG